MPARNTIQNLMTGTLVLCAVLVAGTMVHREFFSTPAPSPSPNRLKPVDQWARLIAGRSADMGKDAAPTKLVLFSDYQCPYCKDLDSKLRTLVNARAGEISVYRYEFPLKNAHAQAYLAATAAKCGTEQNVRDPLQSKLFDHNTALKHDEIRALAREAGVPDPGRFDACLDSKAATDQVDRDMAIAENLGFDRVPVLLVDGVPFEGTVSAKKLEQLIADASR